MTWQEDKRGTSWLFSPLILNHRQGRPKDAEIKSASRNGPNHGRDNVSREETGTVPAWNGHFTPTGKVRKKAGTKVTRGIEAGLGQRRDHGDQDGHSQTD